MEKLKRRRISMNINWSLPAHVIQVIFSKLPIIKLPDCRSVCKSWNALILDHALTTKIIPDSFFFCTLSPLDSKLRGFDFDRKYSGGMNSVASVTFQGDFLTTHVINSCNGLLFLFKLGRPHATACVGILNPMTNEYIKLPGGNHSYEDDATFYWHTSNLYFYGFGFSPKTKCYKVVRVRVSPNMKKSSTFDVFAFGGSNQWRLYVESVPFVIRNHGVYLNGALYWIGVDNRNNGYRYVICRLDVEKETIETTYLLEVGPSREVTLQAFNGSVYATFFFMYPCYRIEVWRMMQNYIGGREDCCSWRREFVINGLSKDWVLPRQKTIFFKLMKWYENGEMLCLINHQSPFLYNPKYGRIKTFNQFDQSTSFSKTTFLTVWQVESSVNFGSLKKILAGDDE